MNWIPRQPFPDIISIFTYAFYVWLGIFIFSQSPKKRSSLIFSLALFGVALNVFSSILNSSLFTKSSYVFWYKSFWWTSVIPVVLWLHASLLLLSEEHDEIGKNSLLNDQEDQDSLLKKLHKHLCSYFMDIPLFARIGVIISYFGAFVFSIIGVYGDWLIIFSSVKFARWPWIKWSTFFIPAGSYYWLLTAFKVICLCWSVLNLILVRERAHDVDKKQMYNWYIAGALLFAISGVFLAVWHQYHLPMPRAVSHLMFSIGIVVIGYSVARYNALVEGKVIKERFLSVFLTFFPLIAVFILIYFIIQPNASTLALTFYVTFLIAGYNLFEHIRAFWEHIFLDPRLSQVKVSAESVTSKLPDVSAVQLDEWIILEKTLTEAEKMVFNAVGAGFGKLSYDEIAKKIFISPHTVDSHLQRIRVKLKCNKTSELPLIWLAINSYSPPPTQTPPEKAKEPQFGSRIR